MSKSVRSRVYVRVCEGMSDMSEVVLEGISEVCERIRYDYR